MVSSLLDPWSSSCDFRVGETEYYVKENTPRCQTPFYCYIAIAILISQEEWDSLLTEYVISQSIRVFKG